MKATKVPVKEYEVEVRLTMDEASGLMEEINRLSFVIGAPYLTTLREHLMRAD